MTTVRSPDVVPDAPVGVWFTISAPLWKSLFRGLRFWVRSYLWELIRTGIVLYAGTNSVTGMFPSC